MARVQLHHREPYKPEVHNSNRKTMSRVFVARQHRSFSEQNMRASDRVFGAAGVQADISRAQTLMGSHMEGSVPHMEGSGVSNP